MWTLFWDMHSGGGTKEHPYEKIYIEAPEQEAKVIFYNRFGHNPERVSCTCCGEDYAIDESETLEQASGYHRGCRYAYFRPDGSECPQSEGFVAGQGTPDGYTQGYIEEPSEKPYTFNPYMTMDEYGDKEDVLIIREHEIKDGERKGDVPDEGYVWVG